MKKSEIKHLISVSTMVIIHISLCVALHLDYPFKVNKAIEIIAPTIIPIILIFSLVSSLRQKSKK